jgi:hypothetical protein
MKVAHTSLLWSLDDAEVRPIFTIVITCEETLKPHRSFWRVVDAPDREEGHDVPSVVNPDEDEQQNAASESEERLQRDAEQTDRAGEDRAVRNEWKDIVGKPILDVRNVLR